MFKLYDKDGNGEIDMEEMEDIFTKLCIVNLLIKFSPLMLEHFYDFSVPSDNMDLY